MVARPAYAIAGGVHERRIVSMRGDQFRFGVVADTHSLPHPDSLAHLATHAPDCILHAGDVGDLCVLGELEKVAPLLAIRGNIDAQTLPDTMTVELEQGGAVLLTIAMVHIGVYGPKLRADAAKLARDERAAIVVCGHSHVPFIGRDKGLVVFNPGSIGPRRFQLPIVFGILDVKRTGISMHHVDCETGKRWEP